MSLFMHISYICINCFFKRKLQCSFLKRVYFVADEENHIIIKPIPSIYIKQNPDLFCLFSYIFLPKYTLFALLVLDFLLLNVLEVAKTERRLLLHASPRRSSTAFENLHTKVANSSYGHKRY